MWLYWLARYGLTPLCCQGARVQFGPDSRIFIAAYPTLLILYVYTVLRNNYGLAAIGREGSH